MDMPGRTAREWRINRCDPADIAGMLTVINAAANVYRGVIPVNCWHEPYMQASALASDIADHVLFSGCRIDERLVAVMGMQRRHNVDLIRHAYVLPEWQGRGVGSHLLRHLCHGHSRPVLIGTWRAADWAIRFYERQGFARVDDGCIAPLLRAYWNVPTRQADASVVLASRAMTADVANRLVHAAETAARTKKADLAARL